jgi:hypothetical protein
MPVKHIPENVWRKVEKELVKAVVATQRPVKESEMIELLLRKGLENVMESDYKNLKEKQA